MTRMLASVTGPAEAEVALAGGADIIDLKDPSRGALGAVEARTVRETVEAIAGRSAVSAVTGDLPMQPDYVLAAAREMAGTGVDYVKIGIFAGGDARGCIRALASVAARTRLVAVLFADRAPDFSLLGSLAEARFAGAMLDTQNKSNGRLLRHMDVPQLQHFVASCRSAGLMAGLAGSLEAPDIPRLLVLDPDLLGFRGALCGPGGRTAGLDLGRVEVIRALIPMHGRQADAAEVDYRLLAARGYAPGAAIDPAQTDVVFVHDLVLAARIGAYAHERTTPQRVRFDVDATILRFCRPAEDMRDVFSYDLITDGIGMLIEAGHVDLVETLAERIAAMLLGHPRVVKASVRVQKLETGSGSVGVAIERTRTAGSASP
ncbi:MAG: (5-formylfuran-3-yl)methyl phosphate synthase [Acetobacteraceae bacterium]